MRPHELIPVDQYNDYSHFRGAKSFHVDGDRITGFDHFTKGASGLSEYEFLKRLADDALRQSADVFIQPKKIVYYNCAPGTSYTEARPRTITISGTPNETAIIIQQLQIEGFMSEKPLLNSAQYHEKPNTEIELNIHYFELPKYRFYMIPVIPFGTNTFLVRTNDNDTWQIIASQDDAEGLKKDRSSYHRLEQLVDRAIQPHIPSADSSEIYPQDVTFQHVAAILNHERRHVQTIAVTLNQYEAINLVTLLTAEGFSEDPTGIRLQRPQGNLILAGITYR